MRARTSLGPEPLDEGVVPAVVDPRWEQHGQERAAGRVRIGVVVDRQALGAGRGEDRQRLGGATVVPYARPT